MINTMCPECSAKFFVAENLVAGKTIRFRCRKCGGTIIVDGTLQSGDGEKPAGSGELGADAALLSHMPPPVSDGPPAAGNEEASSGVRAVMKTMPFGSVGTSVPSPMLGDLALALASSPESPAPPTASSLDSVTLVPPREGPDSEVQTHRLGDATSTPTEAPPANTAAQPIVATEPDPPAPILAAASDPIPEPEPSPVSQPAIKTPLPGDADAPVSKPRHALRGIGLQQAVFTVPEDDGFDVPVDMDESAPEEVEVEPAPMLAMKPFMKPAPPKPKGITSAPGGAGPNLPVPKAAGPAKPLGLKPGKAKLSPPQDDDHVDFSTMGRFSRTSLSLPPPERSFGAPVIEDRAPTKPKRAPMAPASAILTAVDSATLEAATAVKPSRNGLYIALGSVFGLLLIGGALIVARGSFAPQQPVAAVTATATEDEAPVRTAPPVTTRPAETAVPAVPDTAAKPAETATGTPPPAETATGGAKPAETKPAETKPGETKPPATTDTPPKPTETKTAEPAPTPTPASADIAFDKGAAAAAVGGAKGAASGCKQEGGPQGNARVSITFAPSGRVSSASVEGPPFAGTPVGGCVASKFRGIKVPAFTGAPVTVRATVPIF